jgi:citrate lyase subunit beta/citryl-CoA lyase
LPTAYKPRRSALYVPGDKPRALENARGLDADCLILDLEDAVAPEAKVRARAAVCAAVAGFAPRDVIVRINAMSSPWGADDLAAVTAAKPGAILLPKVQDAGDIAAIHSNTPLWAMIETPRGVLNAGAIAGSGVGALVLGSNDLVKDMQARAMPGRENLRTAMSLCVLAARSFGIAVLDAVHNDIADADGFAQACACARDFGFDGKTLIHPSQITVANAAFSPSATDIAAARRVIEAFAKNPQAGVLALDGRMIETLDADIARSVLARAGL